LIPSIHTEPWEAVRREIIEDKGISTTAADKVGAFVVLNGEPVALLNKLIDERLFGDSAVAAEAIEDMRLLFDYLTCMGALHRVHFDLSLARGLDYYTGVIYEAVLTGRGKVA
jgi:histidyl-tRNA synthetase